MANADERTVVTVLASALTALPGMDYLAVRKLVRTGDLALCSGTNLSSQAIRWASKSPWSHVALLVRLQEIDRVIALESVAKIGVRAVPLSRFVSEDSARHRPYPGKIVIARHAEFADKATPEGLRRMSEFAADRLGAPFNAMEMLKIAVRIALSGLGLKPPSPLHPTEGLICSEYVGKCYEQVGIRIPWDGRGFIGPAEFADAPPVQAIARVKTA